MLLTHLPEVFTETLRHTRCKLLVECAAKVREFTEDAIRVWRSNQVVLDCHPLRKRFTGPPLVIIAECIHKQTQQTARLECQATRLFDF